MNSTTEAPAHTLERATEILADAAGRLVSVALVHEAAGAAADRAVVDLQRARDGHVLTGAIDVGQRAIEALRAADRIEGEIAGFVAALRGTS